MRFLPVHNPPNPFAKSEIEYDVEETPGAPLQVFEDHARSILATNDSPDVGFRWSVNPYRGCFHGCAYCLDGETRVRMADGTSRPIAELAVGDAIVGTKREGRLRRFVETRVVAHWETKKEAVRVGTDEGPSIVGSADHRLLTDRGWKKIAELEEGERLVGYAREGEDARYVVAGIEALPGGEAPMFDVTTGTGDFVANGIVSHNCYARPSHEYLSFGAGSDFERKIVVKPRAAELLREAFDKPSWKGELVVFSGITDCYQPLESHMKITQACVDVCIEYQNPAGFITKSPVIERDVERLAELARVASCRVSVSVPFWDPDVAKAMEPWVTPPARRMKIVETLAKAGVPVGVSVSPIVPGLNDEDIPRVLEAARDAGATHAFYVLLRLPGSVRPVFEARLRERLPLRAEKVLRRLREAHEGKLYDSRFGVRGRGGGVYAETIRTLFEQTAKRCGLVADESRTYVTRATFRRPSRTGQRSFDF